MSQKYFYKISILNLFSNSKVATFMKFLTLMLMVASIQVTAAGYAQRITIIGEHLTLEKVFKEIRRQTGYNFIYTSKTIKQAYPVNIHLENATIQEVLDSCFANQPLSYTIENNIIIIKPAESNIKKQLSINKVISGRIVDSTTNTPLSGVTVRVKGTNNGTTTDANGDFKLEVPDNAILLISFIGYETKEIKISNQLSLFIRLVPTSIGLNQLVVVGYGTQRKEDLTGALDVIDGNELIKRQVASTSNILIGMAPGVSVTQQSGKPGGDGASIRIRGVGSIYSSTSPLILVDNVPMSLDAIDPNDIESITILKDAASTAIFGSRAANGVILITTKRGSGQGVKLSYNGFLSKQKPTNLPKKVDAVTHMEMMNVAHQNTTGNPNSYVFDPALIQDYKTHPADNFRYFNTDWEKAILTNTGLMQNHNINITLGSEKVKLFAAGTYLNQQGLTANTYFKKYDFRTNMDISLNSKLTLHGDLIYNHSTRHYPGQATPEFIIRQMLGMPAIGAGKFAEGKYGDAGQSNKRNPIGQAEHGGFNDAELPSVVLKAAFTYKPLKGLELYGFFANNNYSSHAKNFLQNYAVYKPDYVTNTLIFDSYYPGQNSISESYSEGRDNLYTLQGTYHYTIKQHDFKLLGGFQAEDVTYQSFSASRSNLPSDQPYLSVGTANFNNSSSVSENALASFYGRLNYAFADKYLLEVNGRYDGSSRFSQAAHKQWGFFPSASAGWIVSKENFFRKWLKYIEFIKIRGSYGILGNQSIGSDYPFVAQLSSSNSLGYYFNNSFNSGVAQLVSANPEITWEQSKQLDVGIDMQILKAISMTFDYYKRNISHMLLIRPIPSFVGLGAPYVNAGSMQNIGWEFSIQYRYNSENVSFDLSGNLSNVNNKVIDLGGQDISEGLLFSTPGKPLRSYYGYIAEGLFQTPDEVTNWAFQDAKTSPGDIKYKDVSGPNGKPDGKIDGYDRVILGDNYPHYEYGINVDASWKGFDINIFIQGVAKRLNYISGTGAWAFYSSDFIATAYEWQRDYWTPNNPHAKYPRLTENLDINWKNSSYWLYNGAYMRLKNISIGYSIPKKLLYPMGIDQIRLYVSGLNLFTISHYAPGFDPEINNVNGEFYPIMKTYTVGANIRF
ncbi:TonB-linked SusC/RagA family outer membrane protein [Thermoflavifilum aggregans]|uniref:TonB-linked SusC/RagA family outer membrane protein n=2 Tax=Thermoflavifilum aggregans TaxID=454188 RepID=A0A2M9CVM6_9BACT|nr:TonB-linked SusC/RagA family outer membrane protein [Thermoflavifilum aggregans]